MGTRVLLDSKIVTVVANALEPHADRMFAGLGGHWMAVVEVRVAERAEPDDGDDREEHDRSRKVKLRAVNIELADMADEARDEQLRQLLRDMFKERTAPGTFDDPEAEAQADASLKIVP
jgi:hypothetical protein